MMFQPPRRHSILIRRLYDGTMATAATEQRLDAIEWHGNGRFLPVRFTPELIESLAELTMAGYQRYPWGGVEVGGILLGKKEPEAIRVSGIRPIDCEHQYGPSFHLSEKDLAGMDRVLAEVASAESQDGLVPVGWYHSVSHHDFSLADCDRTVHSQFFPQPWQIAVVLQRSKKDPLSIGLFCRDAEGPLESHSQPREFAIENFRVRWPEVPAAPPPAPVPPSAVVEPIILVSSEPELKPEPRLTEDPFSAAPDPRFFYPAPQHQEALASLIYGIQSRQGFLAVMGETGTGKSLVLECLIEHLKTNSIEFACLFNSKINPEEFFQLLAHDLELRCRNTTKTSILIALNEYLLRRSQEDQTTVLIVDSAQKLGVDVLEEIELLGNLENRRGRLLQVIFAAQPSFERQLAKAELRGLRQRLLSRSRLAPLQTEQVSAYVECRMAKAGLAHQGIFPADLLAEIHLRTQGIPRLINAVCSNLLTRCLEDHIDQADIQMLHRVSSELELDRRNSDENAS